MCKVPLCECVCDVCAVFDNLACKNMHRVAIDVRMQYKNTTLFVAVGWRWCANVLITTLNWILDENNAVASQLMCTERTINCALNGVKKKRRIPVSPVVCCVYSYSRPLSSKQRVPRLIQAHIKHAAVVAVAAMAAPFAMHEKKSLPPIMQFAWHN